ncbi:MAG TPA: M1 family metallopeptidase [Terriglobia bacterium]|nr:M1 family metallopeptidase [Terriglobia bacterium]
MKRRDLLNSISRRRGWRAGRTLSTALVVAALLACGTVMLTPSRASAEEPAPPKLRLPAVAAPTRYHLELTLVPDADTFAGAVDIELTLKKATPVLWLNGQNLTVKEAILETGGQSLTAKVIATPKDYIGFSFDKAVGPGAARLHIAYQGKIDRKNMEGVFQVKEGGAWYVYTQFEPIFARKAFPGFDEPGYKVPWQVTLHVKKEDSAFSNTPIVSETDDPNGMKTVKFAETKPLPSYLVAVAVGTFDTVDAGTAGKKHTHIRIVVPHGESAEARYAAKTTPAIVNLLEGYFGIPYPYEKLDEVAIPLAGYAMEHAGMVTYGSGIILWPPDQDSLQKHRLWVSVGAHELAHQWFGDYVTTAWWNDIWLNEGFASWMADKISNEYKPEWHMHISELNGYQGAMDTDALVSSRKVRQPIESDDDIANSFDGITYNKGSALLNMFETYMSPERFQKGIHLYLEKHAWGNATSADFLAALGTVDPAIPASFSSFLDQAGVPEVNASLKCAGGAPRLELEQQRFLPVGSTGSADQMWQIPVCAKYPSGSTEARQCALVTAKTKELTLSKATGCPQWVFANDGAAGYYRVHYQGHLLDSLLKDDTRTLGLAERVGLVGDVAAFTGGGQMKRGEALGMVPEFLQDPAPQVTAKTLEIASGLEFNIVPDSLLPKYRKFLENMYGGRAHELGWKSKPGEDAATERLRPTLLDVTADEAEDPELIAQAKTLANEWLSNHNAVAPDMVGVVLRTAAEHGDRAFFRRLRSEAKKEKDQNTRGQLLNAMGSFRDPEIVKAAMPILLTSEFDPRESLGILFGATQWPANRDLVYDFVKQNIGALEAKLPQDVLPFMPYAAASYCDEQHRADVEAFFKDRSAKYPGGPRTLDQVLEGISLCAANKSAQQASVVAFLSGYGSKAGAGR